MNVVPFKADHVQALSLQENQSYLANYMTEEQALALEHTDWAYTLLDGEEVLGCAGVIEVWPGRGMAWAYISDNVEGARFLAVHKSVKKFLDACYIKRIEMSVDCEFGPAHRWAEMLGFKMEASRMEAYRPDGGACSLYARVL